MLKKWTSLCLIVSMFMLMLPSLSGTAYAAAMDVWTASSYDNVFQDNVKPNDASASINWVMVRNEFESNQILMRSTAAGFTINGVTFSNLVSGGNTIASSNLKYNFVEYSTLRDNTFGQDAMSMVRVVVNPYPGGAGTLNYPDALSNNSSIAVEINKTQPIWVTLYGPKTAVPGVYTGTATVNTSVGDFVVNLSAEIVNATIPDSKDSNFTYIHWQQISGTWHYDAWADNHPGNAINYMFGYEKYTTQWWALMADIRQQMKDHRHNDMYINFTELLLDGGTTVDASGNYTFNWSKFDQFIEFFMDPASPTGNIIKSLSGGPLTGPLIVKEPGTGLMMSRQIIYNDDIGTAEAQSIKWHDQLIPALYNHLNSKGWLGIWKQGIADEVDTVSTVVTPAGSGNPTHGTINKNRYLALLDKIDNLKPAGLPRMKVIDAINGNGVDFVNQDINSRLDYAVPVTNIYQTTKTIWDNQKIKYGNEVFIYNCNWPQLPWLNRFIDTPVWGQRLVGWSAYNNGINGYLHWGWNSWVQSVGGHAPFTPITVNSDPWKGDSFTVYPDTANNRIKGSIRYEANRDAAEDFDIFKILEASQPVLAKNIASSIAPSLRRDYTEDIKEMIIKRNELVRAAGGGNGQASYYKLDEGTGTATTDTWGGGNGTLLGGAAWINGHDGKGLVLDGLDDGVFTGKTNIPPPWTASMWVKRTDSSNASAALLGSKTTALKLEQWNGTNKVGFTKLGMGDYAFNYSATIGKWEKLTFVGTAKGTSLYVDGNFKETINAVIDLPLETIGYTFTSAGVGVDYMKGTIDDVKVYRRALTPAEIAGTPLASAGVANWTFTETGANAVDYWGGNTGKLIGGASKTAGNLLLNGTSAGMDLNMSDIPVPWTASLWVRKDANKGNSELFSSFNGAIKLDQYGAGGPTYQVGFSDWWEYDQKFTYSAPLGWTHLTFVGTSTGISLYVNKVLNQTIAWPTVGGRQMPPLKLPLNTVGYRKYPDGPTSTTSTTGDYVQGAMADVKVFSRALPQAEINQLYDGNVGYWTMDEASGTTTITDAWKGSVGTLNASPQEPTRVAHSGLGNALTFDGVDDGVQLGRADIKGPWTASMWVNRSDSPLPAATLLGSARNHIKLEQYNNTNKVGISSFGIGDYYFNYTAPVGTWTKLTFVNNGTSTTLYVNGVFQETLNFAFDLPMETIGYSKADPWSATNADSYFLKGSLDDLKIFLIALTPAQVAGL
ncbi:LamG-like jellyroll fold domain-containing protein [Cohnella silvisoli]|uniref:DUF4091 domain-containing protein n=1 Tax=Cohnella silvisoli TaxID=2873699 RepID=A0ABV1KLT8_9BACL|nr:LamG-like jellyroll fold domain-containing protein [Cohnella silvisoli]MCD9020614.1 DUF4091 domain-containing protein [Cohnella silvisoli]